VDVPPEVVSSAVAMVTGVVIATVADGPVAFVTVKTKRFRNARKLNYKVANAIY